MGMHMGSLWRCLLVLLLALIHLLATPSTVAAAEHERKLYVIYMGSHIPAGLSPKLYYDKLMGKVIGSEYKKNPSEYLLYSYYRSFYGCAAKLTDAEALQIAGMEGIVSVFPNTQMELHTTRSWDFMGFPINVERSRIEKDVIVGIIDTGIWPESPSFKDTGLSPIPTKWKGVCQKTADFSCNKKIIGARFYRALKDYPINEGPTPRDFNGHGTHTASTVAGGLVSNASLFGYASGIARGGVPGARIAVYKVCWTDGMCNSVDMLRALDDAIADGVDIISMSIGRSFAVDYFTDTIAIGAFHASQRGILASLSAGNSGPSLGTVGNVAPWLMSVAASTIDRKFLTAVQLGNGKVFQGRNAINPFNLRGKKLPVLYGGNAPNASLPDGASNCESLNRTLVQGKIVLCDLQGSVNVASQGSLDAGAAGTLIRDVINDRKGGSEAFPLPTALLRLTDGDEIFSYITNLSSNQPVATIMKTTTVKDTLAPYVAQFSSRGPNLITPSILKPDLSAPGVDILAAYSPVVTPSGVRGDTRHVLYNIISGTSMACPHASAAAAYVKSYHPDWSPAAIRSALMTTAFPLTRGISIEGELAYGAGHINPLGAVDPGLVYDAGEVDYVNFLCGQGFSLPQIKQVSRDIRTTCPRDTSGFVGDLNYPSITVASNSSTFNKIFRRRVTNVAKGAYYPSVYKVKITAPQGVSIKVKPDTLQFTHPGQELSFTVQVRGNVFLNQLISASIEWSDGRHKVRSPVVAFLFRS